MWRSGATDSRGGEEPLHPVSQHHHRQVKRLYIRTSDVLSLWVLLCFTVNSSWIPSPSCLCVFSGSLMLRVWLTRSWRSEVRGRCQCGALSWAQTPPALRAQLEVWSRNTILVRHKLSLLHHVICRTFTETGWGDRWNLLHTGWHEKCFLVFTVVFISMKSDAMLFLFCCKLTPMNPRSFIRHRFSESGQLCGQSGSGGRRGQKLSEEPLW